MKQILVRVEIKDQATSAVEHLTLGKVSSDTEIEVLASGISTLFLKSKEALRIAETKSRPILPLVKAKKR